MHDTESFLLGIAAGGGGGGGNPNYIEMIKGTMANPFGQYTFSELYNGILNNQISATLTFTVGGASYTLPAAVFPSDRSIVFSTSGQANSHEMYVSCATYVNGNIVFRTIRTMFIESPYTVTVFDEDIPPLLPTLLTIIHHPLS